MLGFRVDIVCCCLLLFAAAAVVVVVIIIVVFVVIVAFADQRNVATQVRNSMSCMSV